MDQNSRQAFHTLRVVFGSKYTRHILSWVCVYAIILATAAIIQGIEFGFRLATAVVAPAPLPVYLNFVAMDLLFSKRRYVLYAASLLVVIAVSDLVIRAVFHAMFTEPGAHTSGILTAIFYIAFSAGLRYYFRGLRDQRRLQEIEFRQIETELSTLKSQINPHFLFNTMNNLYALSISKSDRLPDTILKLSQLLRYVLDTSGSETVALDDELAFLKNYIELERLRIDEKVRIEVNVTGNTAGACIAPMLLVPFVENSFKHGPVQAEGCIRLNACVENGTLRFDVENTVPPAGTGNEHDSAKMGLVNVRRRLALLYPGRHQLNIRQGETSYLVELEIEL